jgi:aminoglycoside phosphotransferase (APT) family kinase protein
VGAMRRVRAESDVPVPNILVYDTSRRLLPSDFFIMEFLPGVPFHHLRGQLSVEEQARVDAEMGRLTRQIGTIHGSSFGYWAQPEKPGVTWRECFARMVEGVLQDGLDMDIDLHLPYEQIRARVQRHLGVLDEIVTPQLVHWDLWDGNIFVDPQTLRITGLIDFERALWGDPLIEGIFINIDPASSAAQGYGAELLSTPQRRMQRLLYNVYLHLIMVVECYFRHYQTQDQENWIRPILDQELAELEQKTPLN